MSCSLEHLNEIVKIIIKRKAPILSLFKAIIKQIMVMLIIITIIIITFRVITVTAFHKVLVESIDQACSG